MWEHSQNLLEKTEESRENLLTFFLHKNSVPVSQGIVRPHYNDKLVLAVYGNNRRLFCESYELKINYVTKGECP
jgi:hypothetical protein